MSESIQNFSPDAVFVGDLHLHERLEFNKETKSGLNTRLEDGLSILDQIGDLVRDYSLKYVIFTGDVFEQKDRLPNHILIPFGERIQRIVGHGAEVVVIRGNHDFKLMDYPTLRIFDKVSFVDKVSFTPLEKLRTNRMLGCVPYYRDPKEFKEKWTELHNATVMPDIIVFHGDLPGAYYSDLIKVPGDWDLPTHKKALYIGGHIHRPQLLVANDTKINFVGVPYQLDFEETRYSETKRVFLYNSDENSTISHKLNYPSFVDYDINADMAFLPKNKYIRILGTVEPQDRLRVKEIKENLLSAGANSVQVKVKYLTEYKERIKAEKSDRQGILNQFLNSTETKLDKERLLNTGLSLLEK